MMWMEFQCEAPFVAESPPGHQHFFQVVCGCPKGLLNTQTSGKLFFKFLRTAHLAGQCDCATKVQAVECGTPHQVRSQW